MAGAGNLVAQSLRAEETRVKLHAWFSRYGGSTEVEIEARVREVDPALFEQQLRKMRTNKGWSQKPVTITSSDLLHASGVRETRGSPEGTSFMRKQKIDTFDVFGTDSHHPVRLQASSEKPCAADQTPLSVVRHKKRHTFVHKNLFKFELTEVKSGPSWESACQADTEFEIEIEYCGQRDFKHDQKYVAYLVDALVLKTLDCAAVYEPPPGQSAGHKRARNDGSLACGDVVALAAGTAVALEPVLAYGREREQTLSAQECTQIEWVFSGVEPGKDGAELAHVMSLPSSCGAASFPLFHFSGHVSRAALVRKAPNFDL
ncbi:hypothetical protein T492DRAFT_1006064 [Pavlovales sp. CCMP2436]|nr:hypothetical protein T492DRAFT_1006064 [Pavlovales sp. CCMP2436]|mmetsp:Transcript_12973/g.32931  ORF Transcript_12973/g.32931 Transcript_12973/m.32931 type:complete len:317 (-) Transcript_12973:138-1088(-)